MLSGAPSNINAHWRSLCVVDTTTLRTRLSREYDNSWVYSARVADSVSYCDENENRTLDLEILPSWISMWRWVVVAHICRGRNGGEGIFIGCDGNSYRLHIRTVFSGVHISITRPRDWFHSISCTNDRQHRCTGSGIIRIQIWNVRWLFEPERGRTLSLGTLS